MQTLSGRGHVASFLARGSGRALFVGLYAIGGWESLSREEFLVAPDVVALTKHGMRGLAENDTRTRILRFQLIRRTDFYDSWKGRLIVEWPPPDIAWWRRAHRNEMPVLAILEESALDSAMPEWDALNLMCEELKVLPRRWQEALSHWRGIYYIFDASDGRGYVGSAYGKENILGRWRTHAEAGGDAVLLQSRDPQNFHFTILQRVSPDMEPDEVIRLEGTWKERLHTRQPFGLNTA
jgi:hypothetical protein